MTDQFKSGISFHTRIIAAAMATAVGVLMVACALFTLEQWGAERATAAQQQKHMAAVLAPRLANAILHGGAREVGRLMESLAVSPRLLSATLVNPAGGVIARYETDEKTPSGVRLLQSSTPVIADGRTLGVLAMQSSLETARSFLPRYLALTGALFFAATALSLFLGRLLAKQVVEPVARLSKVMGEVAISGDLAQRVQRIEDDEFGRLIESFNALLDRLQINDRELRETVQALVLARDDAEAANVQKSQFLANMSHEIRTPLNGVLAMTQIMALSDLTSEQRDRLDVIKSSGESLLVILNDILDVSKIEAGKLELEIVEFDLERMIKSTVGGLAAVADGKGVELIVELAPDVGARLGDPARLRQILTNLVSNALKFTRQGVVRVTVEGLGEGGAKGVKLTVADTGIGMAEEKLHLLFQKFTQLDASTTRRFGGTGLGLSICQELTAKMNGSIWAESVEGQGSTFHVELPLPRVAAAAGADADADALPEDQGRPLRVLAAEDNDTNQLVLSTILEIFGADLHIVADGKQAVEAWKAEEYDVILMDIQMPVMDGITAAREIRRAETALNRPHTPIVALSANAMAHQVAEYLAAGMDGHVAKPIELNKLHAALETALASKQEHETRFETDEALRAAS